MADSVTCPCPRSEGCVLTLDGPACPHGVAWFHVSPGDDIHARELCRRTDPTRPPATCPVHGLTLPATGICDDCA